MEEGSDVGAQGRNILGDILRISSRIATAVNWHLNSVAFLSYLILDTPDHISSSSEPNLLDGCKLATPILA